MRKLSNEVARSLAGWDTTQVIEAKGYGSSAWLAPQLLMNERFRLLLKDLPMFSLTTLAKLWYLSHSEVDDEINYQMSSRLDFPGQRERIRKEAVAQAFEIIDVMDFEKAAEKRRRSIENPDPLEEPGRNARSVVISMWPKLDEEVSRLRRVFPMYGVVTLIRVLIMSSFEIDAHITEGKRSSRLEIPGQWEKKRAELEEEVWKCLRKRSLT